MSPKKKTHRGARAGANAASSTPGSTAGSSTGGSHPVGPRPSSAPRMPAQMAPAPNHASLPRPTFQIAPHRCSISPEGHILGYPREPPPNFSGQALLHVTEFWGDDTRQIDPRLVKVMPPMPIPMPVDVTADPRAGSIELVVAERREGADPEDTSWKSFEDPTEATAKLGLPQRYGILRACIVMQCMRAAAEGRTHCIVRFPRWAQTIVSRITREEFLAGKEEQALTEDYMAQLQRELAHRGFIRYASAPLSALVNNENYKSYATEQELADGEAELQQFKAMMAERANGVEPEGPFWRHGRPLCMFISWDPDEAAKVNQPAPTKKDKKAKGKNAKKAVSAAPSNTSTSNTSTTNATTTKDGSDTDDDMPDLEGEI